MKDLVIDARHLKSGIGTYIKGLINEYELKKELKIGYIGQIDDLKKLNITNDCAINCSIPIYTIKEQLVIPKLIKNKILLHVPHYNVTLMYNGPIVTTIHDISHIILKNIFRSPAKRIFARIMISSALKKSQVIITVSEFTKQEILRNFRVNPDKIKVIHNGINDKYVNASEKQYENSHVILKKYNITSPYILYVGNIKPHKNIETLLNAFTVLKTEHNIPHTLVIVGHCDTSNKIKHPGVIQINDCSDQDLICLYKSADLYSILSIYEGFGFTPLEAMNFGVPTVVSDIECHREILKDATLYVDKFNIKSVVEGFKEVLTNNELRSKLVSKGRILSEKYRWRFTAEKTMDIYKEIIRKEINK